MLNLFPIQFLAPLAYTLLRLCAGFILIRLGIYRIKYRVPSTQHVTQPESTFSPFILLCFGTLEICAGGLFILGYYTQVAALIGMTLSVIYLLSPMRLRGKYMPTRIFFLLLFFTSLSLFITGAGAFAFDLPI